jgi:hypothetical protein
LGADRTRRREEVIQTVEITDILPPTFETALLFAMGIMFGRCFGKEMDQTIQKTEWFKSLNNPSKWLVKRILDFTHHWWIGGLLMILAPQIGTHFADPALGLSIYWFGAGLFIDDLPDLPPRLQEMLRGYLDWWRGK